ncbi:MAG TPA: SDR family oxidoreductase [Dehalococcoidia bacterium]|nr:SDR family oxidoreductase [Dehalococcoidia bacterium]
MAQTMIRGAVVVTGASSGIGKAIALRLDRMGFHVLAGARREEDGEALRAAASNGLEPLYIDVTQQHSIDEAERVVAQAGYVVVGLVNNAGIGIGGPYEVLPMERIREQLEVNFFGQVAVSQAFIPHLRKVKGRIVNMGSIAGRVAAPYVGPYSASKFALEAFTDSLRIELTPWEIKVAIVEPGRIETPIWGKARDSAAQLPDDLSEEALALYGDALDRVGGWIDRAETNAIDADEVVKAVVHALTAKYPKTRYLVGKDAKRQALFARWVPTAVRDWLVRRRLGL